MEGTPMTHDNNNGNDGGREDRVRSRAYEIWEREGRREGDHERHWHQARQDVEGEAGREANDASDADRQGEGQGGDLGDSAQTGTVFGQDSVVVEGPLDKGGKRGSSAG